VYLRRVQIRNERVSVKKVVVLFCFFVAVFLVLPALFVCVYMCVYVCIHVYMFVYAYIEMYLSIYVSLLSAHTYIYIKAYFCPLCCTNTAAYTCV